MRKINLDNFRKKKKRLKRIGSFLLFGGIFLLLLDCTTLFPTPIRGQFALIIWLPIILIGSYVTWQAGKPPVKEAFQAAEVYNGILTEVTLAAALDITPVEAKKILLTICRKGYGEIKSVDGNLVYSIQTPQKSPP